MLTVLIAPALTFRTIDPDADARQAYAAYADACRASFGSGGTASAFDHHARWLRARVDEFPDGHVLAFAGDRCAGQLEVQVPYGRTTAYVNLFWVAPDLRGQGYGRRLQEYAERYCRSWEAGRIELDVSPDNARAVGFYRHLGYRFAHVAAGHARLWRMAKMI
jgi:ribosomal protein S18 acetylase RimI-like enzyme